MGSFQCRRLCVPILSVGIVTSCRVKSRCRFEQKHLQKAAKVFFYTLRVRSFGKLKNEEIIENHEEAISTERMEPEMFAGDRIKFLVSQR